MNYKCTMNDYELDMSNDADELPITSPAAARLFGGDDGYQTYGREQRGSMTDVLTVIAPAGIESDIGKLSATEN